MKPVPSGSSNSETEDPPIGGLATGAIIGIAVACGIVGLVLISAIIWFLVRRRRQAADLNGPDHPYGPERSRTEELMAEKEARPAPVAAVMVAEEAISCGGVAERAA